MTIDEFRQLLQLKHGGGLHAPPNCDVAFDHVTEDSRKVRAGSLFFALPGERHDGHQFAAAARDAGAVALAGERPDYVEFEGLPYIRLENARRALGIAAHALAGDPSERLHTVGVTGTNGKSSTVSILAHILGAANRPCATFGTLGYSAGKSTCEAPHTTPFPEMLAKLFAQAEQNGCTDVAMEASSHAIAQERIAGIAFNGAVFTNLTQDHLDYHENFEAYRESKTALFERIPDDGFCVTNRDDPSSSAFERAATGRVVTFGKSGDVQAAKVKAKKRSTRFTLQTPEGAAEIRSPLIGAHNLSNQLAAAAAAWASGVPVDTLAAALESIPPIPGRFERIDQDQDFAVIVDYAHTEDGLRNVLAAARPLCKGRLITVFGCGGDRDKSKRPRMARAVAEGADIAIVTSDNPRTEDPERILLDIEVGMQRAGKEKEQDYLMVLDRREAIYRALNMAKKKDLVLIAGKGHEDYQIIGTERIHFDDREIAREMLTRLPKGSSA